MPSSDARQIKPVLDALTGLRPRRVIDVGAGRGKYGLLVREYLTWVERIDALEVVSAYRLGQPMAGEARWATELDLIYDDVYGVAAQRFDRWEEYDAALIIDVIEHLPKHQGAKLVSTVQAAGCAAVICTPRTFFQNPEADTVPSERHRSLWSARDFETWGSRDLSTDLGVIVTIPPNRRR